MDEDRETEDEGKGPGGNCHVNEAAVLLEDDGSLKWDPVPE